MRFIIVGRGPDVAEIFRKEFQRLAQVEIVCGRFEDLTEFDCVVTAGNSFGLMDAGMDLAVVRYFGTEVMERIQKRILEDHLGEQPVGTAIIVSTDRPSHPFVAHPPTMRTPMNIQGTDHVYLALWATLTAIHGHNRLVDRKINSLASPALGTGTGGMDPKEAALQMRVAYEHFLSPPKYINPSVAQQRQERVYYGGRWGFLHPRTTEP